MITELEIGSPQHMAALRALYVPSVVPMSGRDVAIKALMPHPGAMIGIAGDPGAPRAAGSWRLEADGRIKIINLGVVEGEDRARGLGIAFLRCLLSRYPGRAVWTPSVVPAGAWCRRYGVEVGEALSHGRRAFRMPAAAAAKFAAGAA